MRWMRATLLFGLLAVFGWAVLAGPLQIAPQRAVADEPGGEVSTPEEPTPPVETPTEVEVPPTEVEVPPVETPVATPPAETPAAGEGVTPQAEAPKGGGGSAPAGSESSGGSGGGGGGGGSVAGSGSTGTATVSPTGITTHHGSHVSRPHRSSGTGGGSKAGSGAGNGGAAGGNGSRADSGGGHHAASHSGGPAPIPTVSPQAIDEGATAVSDVAAHVGEVFSKALPTAPLKKLGTRIAAHAGLIPKKGGKAQKDAVDRIGTALGAALIGSAVAVEKPAPSHSPIPFVDPPGGEGGKIFLVVILVALLIAALLIGREVRHALGFGTRGQRVSGRRLAFNESVQGGRERMRALGERSSLRFRRLRADAVAGLRSLF
jgi:hypothetical protein